MEIKQLKTFLIAAETLNFTQTAKMLDYAQSSITAQIKALEEELGTPLFERLGKRIVLTETGKHLVEYARKMLAIEDELKQKLVEPQRVLRIGAQESQCTYRFPPILKRFKEQYPAVELIFKPVHTKEVAREMLHSGELDVAFVTDIDDLIPMMNKEELVQEELVLVAVPSHPLMQAPTTGLEQLINEPLLLTEQGCSYRTQFEQQLQILSIKPKQVIEFSSIEAIKQCAIAGLGISLLPKMVVANELHNGQLMQLNVSLNMSPIFTSITWHKNKSLPNYLIDFISIANEEYGKID
ncbi:LysR family transcriptional regulator [Solibacillus sp. CAU 1738]|uniref:LysR family transcriptional regulator n=1 Tax=Solibacillus sp. CAU 1738 TaxID=3140363 RepID=UPI003260833E